MQVSHQPPSPRFLHLLHSLPSSLLSLTNHFLPLPDKLLHLTHVCRSFPALTPESFACDTVAWTPTLISQLSTTPPPRLLSLLSLVPSALFVASSGSSLSDLCALLCPPHLPSPFSELRAVTLDPLWKGADAEVHRFPSLLASLRPRLTALHLSLCSAALTSLTTTCFSPFLCPLPFLSSLRTLRLSAELSCQDLLLLLSLPLTSLDLHHCTISFSSPPPSAFPPLPPLHTLLLPTLRDRSDAPAPHLSTLWHEALLLSLTTPQVVGAELRLERLLMLEIDMSLLRYIPLLHRLHTLQLNICWEENHEQLVDLYISLTASLLPLRHLRMEHRLLGMSCPQWSSALLTVIPAFVSAYAEQLLTLELQHCWDDEEIDEPQPVTIAKAMTAALLSCHSLRRLRITDWWLSPSVAASSSPPLPFLESLELDVLTRLDEATLAVLLDASPHLQELTLLSVALPYDVLVWVGERCHELRTLMTYKWIPNDPVDYPRLMTLERWIPHLSSSALPKLTTLDLRILPISSDPDIRALIFGYIASHLIHSTPSLRYLHLPHHEWLKEHPKLLCMLGQLTELRGLWLGEYARMQEGSLSQYWAQQPMGSQVLRGAQVDGRSVWGEEALPMPTWPWRDVERVAESEIMRGGAMLEEEAWAEWEKEWDGPPPVFQKEVDGMTGARAFFTAISANGRGD